MMNFLQNLNVQNKFLSCFSKNSIHSNFKSFITTPKFKFSTTNNETKEETENNAKSEEKSQNNDESETEKRKESIFGKKEASKFCLDKVK